ncbi:hypothetical protein RI851_003872 [Vibrio harveyi]|nr:hypothetical protein [Vibrio harveyi]
MDSLEYKNAKTRIGISNPDIWCPYFSITRDQDKSYSSGRTKIPDRVAQWVTDELSDQKDRVDKLTSNLKECFPNADIVVLEQNSDVRVVIDKDNSIDFKNKGKDHRCLDVYSFKVNKKEHILVFFPEKYWSRDEKELKNKTWGLWNYADRNSPLGRSLTSKLTKELFSELSVEA